MLKFKVRGVFFLKQLPQEIETKINSLFSKYAEKKAINIQQESAILRMYCYDAIQLLTDCFDSETSGLKRCNSHISTLASTDYSSSNEINLCMLSITDILLQFKNMLSSAISFNDLPSCERLTKFSVEDAIVAAKNLINNDIVKAGIGILSLNKDKNDAVTIDHVREFYERIYEEISASQGEYGISPTEYMLLDKCYREIEYCNRAALKTGLGAVKEVKELKELLQKHHIALPDNSIQMSMPM